MEAAEAIIHKTVLAVPAVEALLAAPVQVAAPVFIDATFGGGGHSRLILQRLPAGGRLLALDCDAAAAARAREISDEDDKKGTSEAKRFTFVRCNYSELAQVLEEQVVSGVSGVLFDLGVSSMQLDDAARGFSFNADAPLDMRMDSRSGLSAAEWLQRSSEEDIYRALRRYGEEPEARRIARRLFAGRNSIRTTGALAQAVCEAKKQRTPRGRHPATRSFQALRIAVNDELAHLHKGLAAARQVLVAGGRLVVIAFHSLEDRLVKKLAVSPALPGIGRVGVTDLCPIGRMRRPAAAEVAANPRARSACMRVFSKVEAVPV